MAAVSHTLGNSSTGTHLRAFDPRRDLAPVADLVEACFADTLDENGRYYLQRMRSAAGTPGLTSWASWMSDWLGVPLSGYVWEEDGRVVGNASLIPFFVQGRWFYLIANVAVFSEYRRQGIARHLTSQALAHARQRRAASVWLHVREENEAAVALYESLGFIERARRTTWSSASDYVPPMPQQGLRFVELRAQHWEQQRIWLQRSYPPELSWHSTFNLNLLRPGFWGSVHRMFSDAYVVQWGVFDGKRLLAALSWQASAGPANALWLAAPPNLQDEALRTLVLNARRLLPTQRPVVLDYPAPLFSRPLREAGFTAEQTLMWMEVKLV